MTKFLDEEGLKVLWKRIKTDHTSLNNDDIKFSVSFDIIVNLDSKKSYKASMNLDLPTGNVVDNGMQSTENTDLKDIIFKRT